MHKIVIVGGGAGGLELASQLGKKLARKGKADVLLIDQNRTHIWKPLLHEVATGSLDSSTDGVVYHAHAAKRGYQFCLGRFVDLDVERKRIRLEASFAEDGQQILPVRTLSYDTLVLAIGSQSNDFGTPGVAQHCHFLDSAQQAEKFHRALLNQFVRINQSDDSAPLNVSIVGAGATGVELCAELHHVTELLKSYSMPGMRNDRLKVNLIEAGPSILPALPARISSAAKRELQNLTVNVCENTRVKEASEAGFVTAEGELIASDMMIWAAGIKVPDYIAKLGLFELNKLNQIVVNKTLQSSASEDIFVLGDCCGFENDDGTWVPPRAQSAHQMADCVARNIVARLKGKTLQPFRYRDHGSLVSLSRFGTVGNLMGNLTGKSFFIEGKIARAMYISLYRMHQVAIHGWAKALLVIVAEKIAKVVRPKMKLH
ncbi:MAG: NAD(P)/FAD-dependent oxidoreductase [Pseudomonadales bacterium]